MKHPIELTNDQAEVAVRHFMSLISQVMELTSLARERSEQEIHKAAGEAAGVLEAYIGQAAIGQILAAIQRIGLKAGIGDTTVMADLLFYNFKASSACIEKLTDGGQMNEEKVKYITGTFGFLIMQGLMWASAIEVATGDSTPEEFK